MTTTNTLVYLEDVIKLISNIEQYYADNHGVIRGLKRDIEYLPTISTLPEDTLFKVIDEMIETREKYLQTVKCEATGESIMALKELKYRLSLTQK